MRKAELLMNVNGIDPIDRLRDAAGTLLVRRAMDRDDEISEAIFDIAAGDRTNWSTEDWNTLLHDLKACRLRLNDWLDLNV